MSWVFLTRAGSEQDLVDELGIHKAPEVLTEGVVCAKERPRGPDGHLTDPAFARQAMRLEAHVSAHPDKVVRRVIKAIKAHQPKNKGARSWSWMLQVVSPDSSDPLDPRRKVAATLEEVLAERLPTALPAPVLAEQADLENAERLVQVWVLDEERVCVGLTAATQALSRIPGGRTKLKRPADAVSRSGLKLEEAIYWVGVGPEAGDLCADLGAAPGGWTQVAVGRGATVIAIDPAKMKVDLPKKRFVHAKQSAFDYAPPETLDWVICDMAWRPLEVAQLLAKWARRIWARQMIVNFKLPMQQKAKMLKQVLKVLEKAGWHSLRARQLFHDRDEVTIFGYLDPSRAHLAAQPAFEMRSGPKSAGGVKGGKPRKKSVGRKVKAPRGRTKGRAEARGRGRSARGAGPRTARGAARGRGARSGRGARGGPRGRSR